MGDKSCVPEIDGPGRDEMAPWGHSIRKGHVGPQGRCRAVPQNYPALLSLGFCHRVSHRHMPKPTTETRVTFDFLSHLQPLHSVPSPLAMNGFWTPEDCPVPMPQETDGWLCLCCHCSALTPRCSVASSCVSQLKGNSSCVRLA